MCRNTEGVGVNRPGCFAEYMVLPAANVFRLPAGISDEIASILDPLGNATHAALSFNLVGEDVLVTGAGPIGVMAAAIARHAGARHVVVDGAVHSPAIENPAGTLRALLGFWASAPARPDSSPRRPKAASPKCLPLRSRSR